MASGYTGPEIADELEIAHDTVRTHVRNAMVKLGARPAPTSWRRRSAIACR